MPATQNNIPEQPRHWLHSILGEFQLLAAPRAGSVRTGVWHVSSHRGDYFFKLHNNRQRWSSEVSAYREWAPAYEPYIPKMVALYDDDARQGLLVTALSGRPLKECSFEPRIVAEVYRQAGRLCRQLHDLPAGPTFGSTNEQGIAIDYQGQPIGASATDAVAFVGNDFREWLNEASNLHALDANELSQLEEALAAIEIFRYEVPTIINTDYTSNNWLVDEEGKLTGIIDFEHIFRGVLVDAFARFLLQPDFPGLLAFFDGYGSNPLAEKREQARIVCLRLALFYVAYGAKTENLVWIERSKQAMRHLDERLAQLA
jgi:Ser/Thr protein kinase RdoA (MazF antagonist)